MAHKSSAPESQEFELVPAGSHIAMCCLVAYLGFQKSSFNGKEDIRPKMLFQWELCNEKDSHGKPFTISAFYTDSLHKKANMRHMLECWRSKPFSDAELRGFETSKVLGKPCIVTVIHKEVNKDIKARVSAISALPKGTAKPTMINPPLYYTVEPGDPESCDILALPPWIQEVCAKACEPTGKPIDSEPPDQAPTDGEEIPF